MKMPGSSGHATEFKTMSIVDMLESRGMVSNKSTKITSVFESTFAAKKAQKARGRPAKGKGRGNAK